MICDLCKEPAEQIIRVASWQVCQWCVSHKVLEHALKVEAEIAKLKDAVGVTSAALNRSLTSEAAAESKLELAYVAFTDLASAKHELETTRDHSIESYKRASAAERALEDYQVKEERKTEKARHHA